MQVSLDLIGEDIFGILFGIGNKVKAVHINSYSACRP
jgi:hypothetical protein